MRDIMMQPNKRVSVKRREIQEKRHTHHTLSAINFWINYGYQLNISIDADCCFQIFCK